MIKTASVNSLGYALSPIVHNEVMEFEHNYSKGAAKKTRTMPIFIQGDGSDGQKEAVLEKIPVISGNSKRAIARRLLVDRSLDILEIQMDKLFKSKEDARRVLYFFRNGGLTPFGVKVEKVKVGTYETIYSAIPFLLLLGGVYQGHHFEGLGNFGFEIPITKETLPIYKDCMSQEHLEIIEKKTLPGNNDLTSFVEMRYTRTASTEEQVEDKEAMIYGTEVIPAGIYFYSWSSVVSTYDSAILAFRAANYLMQEYGLVGGMTGRGHGRMQYSLSYTDENGKRALTEKDYTNYVDYLKANKKTIIEAIESIPEKLKFTVKSSRKKKKEETA